MKKNILELPFKVEVVLDLSIISGLIKKKNEDDIEYNNAIIDKISLDIISGSVVDFKKEMIGESFVITNPKATSSCGCGLSFSI